MPLWFVLIVERIGVLNDSRTPRFSVPYDSDLLQGLEHSKSWRGRVLQITIDDRLIARVALPPCG